MTTAIMILVLLTVTLPTVVVIYRVNRRVGDDAPIPLGNLAEIATRDRGPLRSPHRSRGSRYPTGPDADRMSAELNQIIASERR